jgi:hypothetical protein
MPIAYPYKFSDWYGYDKDCVGKVPFPATIAGTPTNICSAGRNSTYYHNGTSTPGAPINNPVVGNTVYSDIQGQNKLASGNYGILYNKYIVVNSVGVVTAITNCVTLTQFPITATNYSKPAFACYQSTSSATVWLTDSSPVVNSTIAYSNSTGTTFQGVGFWGVNVLNTQSNYKMTVGSNGVITAWSAC